MSSFINFQKVKGLGSAKFILWKNELTSITKNPKFWIVIDKKGYLLYKWKKATKTLGEIALYLKFPFN